MAYLMKRRIRRLKPLAFAEEQFGRSVQLLGQFIIVLGQTLGFIVRGEIDWPEVFRQCYMIGVKSFFVVSVTALFVGFAMSLQIARELVLFGAELC